MGEGGAAVPTEAGGRDAGLEAGGGVGGSAFD